MEGLSYTRINLFDGLEGIGQECDHNIHQQYIKEGFFIQL